MKQLERSDEAMLRAELAKVQALIKQQREQQREAYGGTKTVENDVGWPDFRGFFMFFHDI